MVIEASSKLGEATGQLMRKVQSNVLVLELMSKSHATADQLIQKATVSAHKVQSNVLVAELMSKSHATADQLIQQATVSAMAN